MVKIQELPKSSSRLLTSSQIITSVYCVVKELIENALDGGAKNVEVKLEDYGLEKIIVKDNGCGIDKSDIQFVAKPHFTSKITSYSDLEKINTYGFRGEALGAVCAVADLVITTKVCMESVGHTVNYNHDGEVTSMKPYPCAQGSTVSVLNLFKNIPVRRQYYRSVKNKKEELRKVEELLIAYGCIAHDVRFALCHNQNLIWQKPALSCTKNALIHILGNSVVDHLKYSEHIDEQNQRKFEIYLPLPEAPQTCRLSSSSKCITTINNRPVRIKNFDKLIKDYYNKAIQNTGKACYPIGFISLTVPLKEVDVNIEPNKTNVMLHNSEEILNQFSEILKTFYTIDKNESNQIPLSAVNVESNVKPKSNAPEFLDSLKTKCDVEIQQTKLSLDTENSIISRDSLLANDVNVVPNYSAQKRQSSFIKKDKSKEPCKKKLKTNSQNDVLTTLKNYFSQNETNSNSNPLNGVPTVTVERICSPQNSSDVQKLDNNGDSNTATSFAISTNISSSNNLPVIADLPVAQKRHSSDSSAASVKFTEEIIKQPVIDDEEAWSRGIHPSGGIFQPVKILHPEAATVSESNSKAPSALVTVSESNSKASSALATVSKSNSKAPSATAIISEFNSKAPSATATASKTKHIEQSSLSFERKLTAFDVFCRSNRLEVAAQNPEFNNRQVAQILSEKWNHLSSEEKAVYKNMLDKDYKQNIKKKESLAKVVSQGLNNIQNKTFNGKPKKMKSKLKDKNVTFNAEAIKEYYKKKNSEILSTDELSIINYLAPGIWICSKNRKLHLLNTFRLRETIIYHRLLETFHFESDPLEKSLNITASDIGNEAMEVLLNLCKIEKCGIEIINDERLTANGFDVKVCKGIENDITVELVGVTNNIAFYGIPDLKELLLQIKNKGSLSTSLSECRPGKVVLYLQGEANRMSRKSPACQRIQDVEDLLNQNNFIKKYNECIHHKPFFNELWNLQ